MKMSKTPLADLLSKSYSVMYEETHTQHTQSADISLGTIHETLVRTETRLTKTELNSNSLENRLQKIENKMTHLNNLAGNVSVLETKVNTFDIEMQSMKKTVTEVETSANAISEMFDSVKTGIQQDLQQDLQQVKGKNEELDSKLSSSVSDICDILKKNKELEDSLTDLSETT